MSNENAHPAAHTSEQQTRSYLRVPVPSPNVHARECATEWSRWIAMAYERAHQAKYHSHRPFVLDPRTCLEQGAFRCKGWTKGGASVISGDFPHSRMKRAREWLCSLCVSCDSDSSNGAGFEERRKEFANRNFNSWRKLPRRRDVLAAEAFLLPSTYILDVDAGG